MVFIAFLIGDGCGIFLIIDSQNLFCAQFFQHGDDGLGGAALAQHQGFFLFHIDAVMLQQIAEAVEIRIVAFQPSGPVDDGIYRTDFSCVGIHLIQIGEDSLLVGDGHIQGGEGFFPQENIQFFPGQGNQVIGILCQLFMDGLGKAVAQFFADEAISHGVSPRFFIFK